MQYSSSHLDKHLTFITFCVFSKYVYTRTYPCMPVFNENCCFAVSLIRIPVLVQPSVPVPIDKHYKQNAGLGLRCLEKFIFNLIFSVVYVALGLWTVTHMLESFLKSALFTSKNG